MASTRELQSAYLVGGCVRDWLLGRPSDDFDIEVFGVSYEQLATALSRWGRADLVGRSFGVLKLTTASGSTYDFNIPRREWKVGIGHTGFAIELDPEINPKEAASRRDYTINALTYDPRAHELLDFFDGQRDLENRVLRHTIPDMEPQLGHRASRTGIATASNVEGRLESAHFVAASVVASCEQSAVRSRMRGRAVG